MRIEANGPTPATPTQTPPTRRPSVEVPLTRTVTSRAEIRAAIARAEQHLSGRTPSSSLVDLATAQACLETGSGRSMFNYNFGGIKGTSPSGMTAVSATHEWEGSTRYRTQARFRAYTSMDEGAQDFLSLLHRRYAPAIAAAERGDVDGYAHALKAGGYFTGPEARYANDLRGLLGLPRNAVAPASESAPAVDATIANTATAQANDPAQFSSTQQLALLLDAVSMSAARIASPESEEG